MWPQASHKGLPCTGSERLTGRTERLQECSAHSKGSRNRSCFYLLSGARLPAESVSGNRNYLLKATAYSSMWGRGCADAVFDNTARANNDFSNKELQWENSPKTDYFSCVSYVTFQTDKKLLGKDLCRCLWSQQGLHCFLPPTNPRVTFFISTVLNPCISDVTKKVKKTKYGY